MMSKKNATRENSISFSDELRSGRELKTGKMTYGRLGNCKGLDPSQSKGGPDAQRGKKTNRDAPKSR